MNVVEMKKQCKLNAVNLASVRRNAVLAVVCTMALPALARFDRHQPMGRTMSSPQCQMLHRPISVRNARFQPGNVRQMPIGCQGFSRQIAEMSKECGRIGKLVDEEFGPSVNELNFSKLAIDDATIQAIKDAEVSERQERERYLAESRKGWTYFEAIRKIHDQVPAEFKCRDALDTYVQNGAWPESIQACELVLYNEEYRADPNFGMSPIVNRASDYVWLSLLNWNAGNRDKALVNIDTAIGLMGNIRAGSEQGAAQLRNQMRDGTPQPLDEDTLYKIVEEVMKVPRAAWNGRMTALNTALDGKLAIGKKKLEDAKRRHYEEAQSEIKKAENAFRDNTGMKYGDDAERLYRQNLLTDEEAREYRKCEIVHDVYDNVKQN